jgi:hypothetical protein
LNYTIGLGLFVIVSAIGTTVLLRLRRIPVASLMGAENFDWRMARRVIGTFVFFTAMAQLMAALPFVNGQFQWQGAPGLLWAVGLLYVYFWVRCIALLMRNKET